MSKISRRMTALVLLGLGLGVAACSSSSDKAEESTGQLSLPLVTQGPSGTSYRLRNATFSIQRESSYYYGDTSSDAAGASGGNDVITVSSEDQPDAKSVNVSLEQGNYYVQLLPGWTFEKDGPDGPQTVTATLLSSAQQWVWISPYSTSWAEYQFGIGDRTLWLNGQLNIEIVVYENPSQYYGGAGDTGSSGSSVAEGGAPSF